MTSTFQAKKSLGQNFLKDKNAINKISASAELKANDYIVEIGPGLGALTEELAKHAEQITTIELDDRLIPILEKKFKNQKKIKIIHKNALDYRPEKTPYKIVANIPYYITSPLISHFLHTENRPEIMVLLVQKEVAEKICAEKKLNVLALHVKNFGDPQIIATVPASAFKPAPKVNSAILKIKVYKKPIIADYKSLFRLIHQAFSKQRKKLSNSLPERKDSLVKLELADKRPENLTLKDWNNILQDHPS